jgi:outer membrane protein assembly factor BamB
MTGVPPDEEVRQLWLANREEFDLPPYAIEQWRKETTQFVFDAKGLDIPGSPAIKGSFFPLIDLTGSIGPQAAKWNEALDAKPSTKAVELDALMAQARKIKLLSWFNGRGFINTHKALSEHLLTKPTDELKQLREVQELRYKKTMSTTGIKPKALDLFRRHPWSESAQRTMLKTAAKHMFAGEAHAAFRSYQDVLRHAEAKDLCQHAQVGLWVSLSKIATPEVLAKAFKSVKPDDTWPWYGKVQKTTAIQKELLSKVTKITSPLLSSIKPNTIRLPPMPMDITILDMQVNGGQLLVSGRKILALFPAKNPAKPIWLKSRRIRRQSAGGEYVLPCFSGKQIITGWGGKNVGNGALISLNRSDKSIQHSGMAHGQQSRHINLLTGSPVIADNKVYSVQIARSYSQVTKMHEYSWYGDVSLGCFELNGLKNLWSKSYDFSETVGMARTNKMVGAKPVVNEGSVYFVSSSGHIICADSRDGSLEWAHFFRPETGDNYRLPPSKWCVGAAPLLVDDKVICMSKFSGQVFALDKKTGRRLWALPRLRGYEILGHHEGLVLLSAANSLYGIDINTGKLRWARNISKEWTDGFQLPRAQLIGNSIYSGNKKSLYRFDAKHGALLESKDWNMGTEVPMTFHISGNSVYVLSDLPARDAIRDRQFVEYHTVVFPAGGLRDAVGIKLIPRKDGSVVYWREGMLFCLKDKKLLWSRFVTNAAISYTSRTSEKANQFHRSWPGEARTGSSAIHDSKTGQLLSMHLIDIAKKKK